MKRNEEEARKLCAYCNWASDCESCSHLGTPRNRWLKEPRFDYKKCEHWRFYIDYPGSKLGKFLCKIGLHDYFFNKEINKEKCLRCLHENRVRHVSMRMMVIDPSKMH